MTVKTLSVKCPTCNNEVLMTPKFPERPFCCKRCKLIDLGEWASESHKIPGEELLDEEWSEGMGRRET